MHYGRNRVFNNYSGNRPAEPTSVAIVATIHTLTRLMLHLVKMTNDKHVIGRRMHPWETLHMSKVLKRFLMKAASWHIKNKRRISTWSSPYLDEYMNSKRNSKPIMLALTRSCIGI